MHKKYFGFGMMILFLFCTACETDITVQCHSDTTNLKFEDEYIGTMAQGENRTVPIKSVGATLVTWTNYKGQAESTEIAGVEAEDGRVWHLYSGYGSWDEW